MTKESEKEKRNGRERIKNGGASGVKISFIRDVTSRTINEPILARY